MALNETTKDSKKVEDVLPQGKSIFTNLRKMLEDFLEDAKEVQISESFKEKFKKLVLVATTAAVLVTGVSGIPKAIDYFQGATPNSQITKVIQDLNSGVEGIGEHNDNNIELLGGKIIVKEHTQKQLRKYTRRAESKINEVIELLSQPFVNDVDKISENHETKMKLYEDIALLYNTVNVKQQEALRPLLETKIGEQTIAERIMATTQIPLEGLNEAFIQKQDKDINTLQDTFTTVSDAVVRTIKMSPEYREAIKDYNSKYDQQGNLIDDGKDFFEALKNGDDSVVTKVEYTQEEKDRFEAGMMAAEMDREDSVVQKSVQSIGM